MGIGHALTHETVFQRQQREREIVYDVEFGFFFSF